MRAADVAIIGYGPVGQLLALKMAQRGHSVVVVERWSALYGLPRAVALDHEVLRILQSSGLMGEFESRTCRSKVYEWRNGQGELLMAFGGMDSGEISGWPAMSGFSQPALERLLDDRVRGEHAGQVELMQGWSLNGLTEHTGGVALRIRPSSDSHGPERSIAARYVVGCDGAGSFVRAAMGASMEELDFAADWLVVDVLPRDPARWNADLVQVCDPSRPTTMVAGGPGRRRFEFMLLPGERKEDMNRPAAAWSLLERWDWTPDNAVLERHAVYTFRACVSDIWRKGRVMLAGDAAHLMPPFAAQGLCTGLRDVAALAWRLDLLLRGSANDALLDSYAAERAPHARQLIEFAVDLGRTICVLDPPAAAARDAALRADKDRAGERYLAPRLGESALLRSGDPHAGKLGLQARVRSAGRLGMFDDVVGSGFVLLGLDHDPKRDLDPGQREFLAALDARVVGIGRGCAIQDVDGSYRSWFADLGAGAVLVRPDFYLVGAGQPGELVDVLMHAPMWNVPNLLAEAV